MTTCKELIAECCDVIRVITCFQYAIFAYTASFISNKIFGDNIDPVYGKIEDINIGNLVTSGYYDDLRGSHIPLGSSTIHIERGSVGWVVEKFSRFDRPGSAMQIRVLFPQGLCWVSQYSLRRVKDETKK
jgi:hypothetical protein